MTVKERLTAFVKDLGISKRAFERKVGLSHGYISNMVHSIQPDKLDKITHHYPQLSPGWLMTGEGDMLKSNYNSPNDQQSMLIPLLPVSAEGGSMSCFSDAVMLKECKMIPSHVDDAQFAMFVTGNSIDPEHLPSEDNIKIKYMELRVNNGLIEGIDMFIDKKYKGALLKTLKVDYGQTKGKESAFWKTKDAKIILSYANGYKTTGMARVVFLQTDLNENRKGPGKMVTKYK